MDKAIELLIVGGIALLGLSDFLAGDQVLGLLWFILSAQFIIVFRMKQAIRADREGLLKIIEDSPELNMSNYTEDQVEAINNAMTELHRVLSTSKTERDGVQT